MNNFRKIKIYAKKFARAMVTKPSWETMQASIKYFPSWLNYVSDKRNSISDSMPWLTFSAIDFLKKIIHSEMIVFEFGSGGSTLFWSAHVKKVVSIEHESTWYKKMHKQFLKKAIGNVEYILAEAVDDGEFKTKDFSNPAHYISSDPQFAGKNFKNYVKQIDRFSDESFDIIVVDGRARPSCISHSFDKLKVGGYLIVDNSERAYYLSPFSFDKSEWNVWKFYGPVPYIYHFSETTIFQKK